jgi:hypothetical protein
MKILFRVLLVTDVTTFRYHACFYVDLPVPRLSLDHHQLSTVTLTTDPNTQNNIRMPEFSSPELSVSAMVHFFPYHARVVAYMYMYCSFNGIIQNLLLRFSTYASLAITNSTSDKAL